MEFKNELVLSFVQSYLNNAVDHINSQLTSKYLYSTGSKDLNRPLPPLGLTIKKSRKKKDIIRLEKHCAKLKVKEVYLESELPAIHSELVKLEAYDILNVNFSMEYLKNTNLFDVNDYDNSNIESGVYIPVMYPRQVKPVWSMIYAAKKHSVNQAKKFVEDLKRLKIHGIFHGGLSFLIIETSKLIIQQPRNKSDSRYTQWLTEANSPYPFDWWYTTSHYRWTDMLSNRKPRVTHG